MSRILEKVGFNLKKKAFKILKPQLIATAQIMVNNEVKKEFFCESFTFNWMMYWYARAGQASANFISSTQNSGLFVNNKTRQQDGTYYSAQSTAFSFNAPLGSDKEGIVLGTGTTTPAALDYDMESLIAEGSSTGQFNHQLMTGLQGCEIAGSVTDFIIQRVFINNSGGAINVTELGIYGHNSDSERTLILHDVFTAVPVPDTNTITVQVKFSITT